MIITSKKIFPEGYQQLKYISTANGGYRAYINTGIILGSDVEFDLQFTCGDISSTWEYGVFGSYAFTSEGVKSFYVSLNNYNSTTGEATIWFHYCGNSWTSRVNVTDIITVSFHDKVCSINGDKSSELTVEFSNSTPGYLGCVNSGSGEPAYAGEGINITYLKLWKAQNLVAEYFPIRQVSTDLIGVYDTTNSVNPFKSSDNPSASFTAGPNSGINTVKKIYTKVDGEMKEIKKIYTKVEGEMKVIYDNTLAK